MIINSVENKTLLMEVLNAKITEEHINVHNKMEFNNLFDQVCNFYQKNKFKYGGDINEINKRIISECYAVLMDEQKRKNQQRVIQQPMLPQQLVDISDKFNVTTPYDTSQEKKMKLNNFNNSYKQRLSEFNDSMDNKKPEEIDFSFKTDETLNNENMNYMLKQKIKERELLNVGIPANEEKKTTLKNVTFSDNIIEHNQPPPKMKILDKLKKKNILGRPPTHTTTYNHAPTNKVSSDQIMNLLSIILKNQEKIIKSIADMENKINSVP